VAREQAAKERAEREKRAGEGGDSSPPIGQRKHRDGTPTFKMVLEWIVEDGERNAREERFAERHGVSRGTIYQIWKDAGFASWAEVLELVWGGVHRKL
jgi:hypothetical protein